MGRTITPRYSVRYITNGTGYITAAGWRGRATAKRLAAHVLSLNASLLPGGVNEQAGRVTGGETMQVVRAEIRENCLGGAVVATWTAPSEIRETVRQMMQDWNAATPAQREAALATSGRLAADAHRLVIARQTLRMADPMVAVMGGMSKAEALGLVRTRDAIRDRMNDATAYVRTVEA